MGAPPNAAGRVTLPGYTIGFGIIIFAIRPAWGLCNAAATLVGQNLGANNPSRAERAVWLTGYYNTVFMVVVTVFFVLFSEHLVGIFTDDPAIQKVGAECLRVISYGYVFFAWGMVMVQAFNGAGEAAINDVLGQLGNWGPSPATGPCPWDLNRDGDVGINDFLGLLADWGPVS